MAYQNPDLRQSVDRAAFPRVIPETLGERTLGAIGGAPALARLTPLSFDTVAGKLAVWANAGGNGTNKISFFLWGGGADDTVQTDAALDTLVTVIIAGELHYADVPVPAGETLANLKTALRDVQTRQKDFTIRGLDAVQ